MSGRPELTKSSENTGAEVSKTYSAWGCGWLRLRGSMATKTKKSGSMLKAGIGREQLVFASDNLSANPNACSRISRFCCHSAVTSATHTPAQKGFSKRRSAVFWKYSRRKGLDKCRFRKRESAASRYRLREKFTDVVVGWRLCFVDEVPPSRPSLKS